MNYSQISQDVFVFNLFEKKPGFFLDLGCGNGKNVPCGNNTLLLEENGWTGIGVDIDINYINTYNSFRKSKGVCADLTKITVQEVLEQNNAPTIIDFLSFDVDEGTDKALESLSLQTYSFKFITFEHNEYCGGIYENLKNRGKEKFLSAGYEILIENVHFENHGFVEDWYFLPNQFNPQIIKKLNNINHRDILTIYKYI
jgi:SAM-dependent methyltransferase